MAKTAREQQKGRPRGRPFAEGVSGNPRGRPKKGESFAEVIRDRFTRPRKQKVADKAIVMAEDGNLAAMRFLRDTTEGKPTQGITIDIEHRIIEAAEREGVDPKEAVEAARRIIEDSRW